MRLMRGESTWHAPRVRQSEIIYAGPTSCERKAILGAAR
jgi:hypothetical protein